MIIVFKLLGNVVAGERAAGDPLRVKERQSSVICADSSLVRGSQGDDADDLGCAMLAATGKKGAKMPG